MEKKAFTGSTCYKHNYFWFVIVTSFIFILFLYFTDSSSIISSTISFNGITFFTTNFNQTLYSISEKNVSESKNNRFDSCSGRYIYVHQLPARFNEDLLINCKSLLRWTDVCPHVQNFGFGKPVVFSNSTSWFATNQFMLDVIFHNRMKRYECLTNDSSLASLVFVPFYAGLEVGRNLWGDVKTTERDRLSVDLISWLVEKPEWKVLWGRDHFLVSGRIAWDFRRASNNDSDWGSRLMFMPESKNMTMLAIESTCWNNDIAIPYPTYFHPSSKDEVDSWQNQMRKQKRRYLFSFAGAPRPGMKGSIRSEIINQCKKSSKKCKLLNCISGSKNCKDPVNVIKMFRKSVFCIQPPGDSFTRRSTFDSILAGCIPVFFNPRSAYLQYVWHLPKNYTKYSVFIPIEDVQNGKASIKEVLMKVSRKETLAMREEVIRLIPKVIYANPKGKLENIEDAFDLAIKGMIERVETTRKDILEGRRPSFEFGERSSWN